MTFTYVPMQAIAQRFKGSYDIASVAEALHREVPMVWNGGGAGLAGVRTLGDLYAVRQLCCYEFVHLCAFLAGQQKLRGETPMIGANAGMVYEAAMSKVWTSAVGNLARGKIVVFVAWGTDRRRGLSFTDRALNLLNFNNSAGYFHVGIARGDGRVISLASSKNIHIEELSDADDVYAEVRYADYA